MATRATLSFTVVRRAAGSPRPSDRMTCSIHALSLPLLHETRIFIAGSFDDIGMQCPCEELDAFSHARTRHDSRLLIEEIDAGVPNGRQ
jgi:hypothetical protein